MTRVSPELRQEWLDENDLVVFHGHLVRREVLDVVGPLGVSRFLASRRGTTASHLDDFLPRD